MFARDGKSRCTQAGVASLGLQEEMSAQDAGKSELAGNLLHLFRCLATTQASPHFLPCFIQVRRQSHDRYHVQCKVAKLRQEIQGVAEMSLLK